jgi:hypothetical protein
MRRLAAAVVVGGVLLSGCSKGDSSGHETDMTARGLASLVVAHVNAPARSAYEAHQAGKTGATVLFGSGLARVQVSVGSSSRSVTDLMRKSCVGCETTDLPNGDTLQVTIGDTDPGNASDSSRAVAITLIRDTEIDTLLYQGPPIPIARPAKHGRLSLEVLKQIVQDPGFGLTTTQGVVDEGRSLDIWTDEAPS